MSSVHVSTESKQDHASPPVFLGGVEQQFGCDFQLDLAARADNRKCARFLSQEVDSLKQDWASLLKADADPFIHALSAAWLNPPFRGVDPWMEKCKVESKRGCRIVTLTLASLGTGWYRDHVEGNGLSLVLRKRIYFLGQKDPFPKELMITLWGFGLTGFGFWDPPAWAVRQDPEGERSILAGTGAGWSENRPGIGDGRNHPALPPPDEELWPLEDETPQASLERSERVPHPSLFPTPTQEPQR
jgi:phage N-6-adenine-methyltransferase